MIEFDFDELRNLEDGWDSYNAPKPTECSIMRTAEILGYILPLGLKPNRILASAEGGVAIIFSGVDIRRALIEILNGGCIYTLLYDMDGFSNTLEWKNCSEESTKNAVYSIQTWLYQ
jgi:hypothetical protein